MTSYIGPHSALSYQIRQEAERRVAPLPEPGPPDITLANALAYLKSETLTRLKGEVSLAVIEARTAKCLSCKHRGQRSRNPDPIGFCLVCGCGDSDRGALSRKIRMRGVRRPAVCPWPDGDE